MTILIFAAGFKMKQILMKNIKDEVRAIVAEKLGVEIEQVIDSGQIIGF